MRKISLVFLCGFITLLAVETSAQKMIAMTGTVVDRPKSDTLLLSAVTTSTRDKQKIVRIPIIEGKFAYNLDAAHVEAYQLIFKDEFDEGAWRPVYFFSDSSAIQFTLHPSSSFDKNSVKGGAANKNYYEVYAAIGDRFKKDYSKLDSERTVLSDNGNYRSKEHAEVIARLKLAKTRDESLPVFQELEELRKTGAEYTPAGQQLIKKYDSVALEVAKMRYEQMNAKLTEDAYFLLWRDATTVAKTKWNMAQMVMKAYPKYKAKFPDHPYTNLISSVLNGAVKIVPGNNYVDFSAPTLDGKEVKLSERINGKVAIIDLWASWCGPCIAQAKAMLPIYKKYKDKGFTIVGVAREFKTLDALKFRLKEEKFPWQQLAELDDKNGIWNKYAVGDGGGIQVLVDQQGKILAINPSAAEVEQYIKKLLRV